MNISKIFTDSLQTKGKWSSKKIMTAMSFNLLAIGFLTELIIYKKANMEMFYCFVGLAGGTSILSTISAGFSMKVNQTKNTITTET